MNNLSTLSHLFELASCGGMLENLTFADQSQTLTFCHLCNRQLHLIYKHYRSKCAYFINSRRPLSLSLSDPPWSQVRRRCPNIISQQRVENHEVSNRYGKCKIKQVFKKPIIIYDTILCYVHYC